jgi:death-on-curing protein
MTQLQRIEIGDFLLIAESHVGVRAEALARSDRVLPLAEAALAAPFAGFGDFEAYPAFEQKAAIYLSRIIKYHPLPDGNKRTAYDVMREFVDRNGWVFLHEDGDILRTAKVIEEVAAGEMDEAALTTWMKHRLRRP